MKKTHNRKPSHANTFIHELDVIIIAACRGLCLNYLKKIRQGNLPELLRHMSKRL